MKILMVLVLGAQLALAQANAPVTQQGGDCSINVDGSNNTVSLVCKSVDPKLAEQITAILRGTHNNEKATKEISGKLDQILKQMNKETVPPLVGLRFVGRKFPALQGINESNAIARDIRWQVVLWDMDHPSDINPLQIPGGTFDWLKPHDEGGPQNIFQPVIPLLKAGDRLLGTASVNCPECSKGKTYIVYIVWGESGWFSEVSGEDGKVIVPRNPETGRDAYFKLLEAAASEGSRIPIVDPQF